MDHPPQGDESWNGKDSDPSTSRAPYRIYNIGNNSPVGLMEFIKAIETTLGKEAKKNFLPMQPGDVPATWADVDDLVNEIGYSPGVSIKEGVGRFIQWYKEFYGIK